MTDAEVSLIRSMLGGTVPEEAVRRAITITGSANSASEWLLENDWHEIMTASGAAAPEGIETFWCAFDDQVVHKGHLQLMNVRPKTLSHSKITLSTIPFKARTPEAAQCMLGDVWAHEPGYWLLPIGRGELDDAWWKVLEPHLLRKCFGEVIMMQTVPATQGAAAAQAPLPAFDEIEDRASSAAAATRHHRNSHDKGIVAVAVFLGSSKPSELRRIGDFLCALFPQHSPLYFRKLVGTATADNSSAAFANDPRAEPSVLLPSWHEKHAEFRITKLAEKKTTTGNPNDPLSSSTIAFGINAHTLKKWRYELEKRSDDKTGEWVPVP